MFYLVLVPSRIQDKRLLLAPPGTPKPGWRWSNRNRIQSSTHDLRSIYRHVRVPMKTNVCCICSVRNSNPKARLALVGKGPDSDALKEHFSGTKTVLTGVMSGEALSQAFASADVFVMPSDSETLGFVVLESMASGVPVVGANAGGIPDLIEDGKVRLGCCVWACLW